ncbi:hypothetical protein PIB30_013985 [Stylosanthes scabra]|uniref:Uncharacterized protein n=1 Tax=Stylosanthes scabra TaxID=79078 RepID=A0ABU6Y6U5_9FABA|nr:hypothetical protein [Stylosanthes scabra]
MGRKWKWKVKKRREAPSSGWCGVPSDCLLSVASHKSLMTFVDALQKSQMIDDHKKFYGTFIKYVMDIIITFNVDEDIGDDQVELLRLERCDPWWGRGVPVHGDIYDVQCSSNFK